VCDTEMLVHLPNPADGNQPVDACPNIPSKFGKPISPGVPGENG
jgi:hypothetical protein